MREIFGGILLILLLSTLGFAQEIPAPFAKAKELAMRADPDEDGDYIYKVTLFENGVEVRFGLCWIVTQNLIGIWSNRFGALAYSVERDEFYVVYMGMLVEVDRSKAIEHAFKIFRELVRRGLI